MATGSTSSLESMLKHIGKSLTIPVKKLLMPGMLDVETEKVPKIAVLSSFFPELIEQYTDSH